MKARRRQPLLSGSGAVRVRRVLYLNGLRGGQIDDAMQEIELRALQQPPQRRGSATAWACVVATNLAMDVHRRAERQPLAELVVNDGCGFVDMTGPADLREAVRGGLAALAPELRATVVLRLYADFTIPEIATAMAVPAGTVKSRLHRAMSELRRRLPVEVVT
jgi:RNA polymerase sigma-70 factor, ECF subfamily